MIPITGGGSFTQQNIDAINSNFNALSAGGGIAYYLDPANSAGNSSDTNNGLSQTSALLSLSAAYAKLRSGSNDGIYLLANGATTATARLSATFTWAKNSCWMVGVGSNVIFGQRARIAPVTTATAFANFFVVSGIGNTFANLEFFQGFGTGTTAEIGLTVSGARNAFYNCQIVGMADAAGAADAGSRHLKISTGENYFSNCVIGEDTVTRTNANASVEFSGNCARNVFDNCLFPAYVGSGGAPVFVLTSAVAAMDRFQYFRNCQFTNATLSAATAMTAAITLHTSSGGGLLLDAPTFVGVTAIADSASKSSVYLNGPAPNGGAGIAVVVT